MFLPHLGAGFWPLVSMGAILGGTMRSPFTGVIFAIELTHDINMMLPLMLAVTLAHGFTVLTLKRSILTEKVARRGFHLSREYAVDPLEILFVREVMRPASTPLPQATVAYSDEPLRVVVYRMARSGLTRLPVVDGENPTRILGEVSLEDLLRARTRNLEEESRRERVLRIPFARDGAMASQDLSDTVI